MPRTLTVRQIRNAIYRAAGGPASSGSGAGSTMLLGQWFHEIFALLLSRDSAFNREAASGEPIRAEPLAQRLERYVYQQILGPRLVAHRAHLEGRSTEVLSLWTAVRELCGWLVALAESSAHPRAAFTSIAEHELSWEVSAPGWADSVIINGVIDAVFKRPRDGRWCVVELKLGKSAPEADLAQVCLYHLMLSAAQNGCSAAHRRSGARRLSTGTVRTSRLRRTIGAGVAQPDRADWEAGGCRFGLPRAGVPGASVSAIAARQPAAAPTSAPISAPQFEELGRRLLKVFEEFNAPVKMAATPVAGPAFVRFFITPNKGVAVKKVTALTLEIQNRLTLNAAPLIGLSQGRTTVDIQRPDRQTLLFRTIRPQLAQLAGRDSLLGGSLVPIGVDLEGRLACANLADSSNAHILVAGTTGSGKSEWLRCALAGLIATNTPETLKLVLIDPKRNAFSALKGSPYLFGADALVYPDEADPADVLDRLIEEMEARYRLFEQHSADDLRSLVQRTRRPLARIVCVCDEYADLIAQSKAQRQSIEERLRRLGNKARASGIHLILATQNPSREVVRGTLDANMPCRVGLKMSKALESKMLLGRNGAENLLGHGDLLFLDVGDPRRLQAPLLTEEDRRELFGAK